MKPNGLSLNGEPVLKLSQRPSKQHVSPWGPASLFSRELLNGQAEMLFNGSNTLLQALYPFLNLAIREVNESACFSKLLFKEGSIFGMAPVEMQLKSFGNKLEFMTEPFRQHASVPFGVNEFSAKGVGR